MITTNTITKFAALAGMVLTFGIQSQAMTCINYGADITDDSGLTNIAQENGITKGTLYGLNGGESIQDVINTCYDTPDNPVTIILGAGDYDSFSMINATKAKRYINIIGSDKKEVTITDDSGRYDSPAAEIYTDGIIKNIKFVSTLKNLTESTDSLPAYAVHLDYGQVVTEFDNCDFIAYNAPAVGIGLTDGTKITFKDCLMKLFLDSHTETMFECINALYCHTSQFENNASNQFLELYNCTIDAQSSNGFAMVLQELNGNNATLVSVDSNYLSVYKNPIVFGGFKIAEQSAGNNVDVLNTGTGVSIP